MWLAVETTADIVGCDACGTRAVGHGRRVVRVRNLPMGDRSTMYTSAGVVPSLLIVPRASNGVRC